MYVCLCMYGMSECVCVCVCVCVFPDHAHAHKHTHTQTRKPSMDSGYPAATCESVKVLLCGSPHEHASRCNRMCTC
jgi:hypothetical protein